MTEQSQIYLETPFIVTAPNTGFETFYFMIYEGDYLTVPISQIVSHFSRNLSIVC